MSELLEDSPRRERDKEKAAFSARAFVYAGAGRVGERLVRHDREGAICVTGFTAMEGSPLFGRLVGRAQVEFLVDRYFKMAGSNWSLIAENLKIQPIVCNALLN